MPKPLKLISILTISTFYSLILPKLVFAAECTPTDEDPNKSLTGLGFCNDLGASNLVNKLLTIAIGAAGGVAFLLLVYGGFRLISSQGDPKALQEARGVITSAISGLLFIIFAVFILRLIGISILGLPL